VTRSIFRLLPPPGCPTGTVIAPGDMRGYRRLGESGLSDTKYFSRHDLWRVVGKKYQPRSGCSLCRAGRYNRHSFTRFFSPIGMISHLRWRRVRVCRLSRGGPHSLTAQARPIHSANESGGLLFVAVNNRQTGNSGAIPGRPRRCDRAGRPLSSMPLRFFPPM